MDELHSYVSHIWNEWARGFVPGAPSPWFVREDWLEIDEEIRKEFIRRIGCLKCDYFDIKCKLTENIDKEDAKEILKPCDDPDI